MLDDIAANSVYAPNRNSINILPSKHNSINDLLKSTTAGNKKHGKSDIFYANGTYADPAKQAKRDFDKIIKNPEPLKDGKGWIGELPDKTRVVVRDYSSGGEPTIEIRRPETRRVIKIRYRGK